MEYNEYGAALAGAFEQNGIGDLLNEDKAKKLYIFSKILIETNKSFNLTAITDENDIILKHFVDCAAASEYIPIGSSLIDVGCGAGFPSIPLAILREDIRVTSLDSTSKKISFISSVAKELGLSNISAICHRAEEYAADNREEYDVCISRAVARLNVLDELCIPFVKKNGLFIAMKSSKGEEEYAEARCGIEKLGCKAAANVKKTFSFQGASIERDLYIFEKISLTPKEFPRKYAQILKRPL